MLETLKADFNRYYDLLPTHSTWWQRVIFFLGCQGMWAIVDYRFRRWLLKQPRWIRWVLFWPVFLGHTLVLCLTGISIPSETQIGKGLYIGHFSGIFLTEEVVMGEDCSLSQGVTIGLDGTGQGRGAPRVGDHVYFGAGAKVFGKITIGSNVKIGANAVVLKSVPEGATAVGVPARIVAGE